MGQTKITNKLWLAALMVALLATLLCLTAGAETVSGLCGENLTWTLDTESGELTINGTGNMNDYGTPPWYSYRDSIQKVIIGDGVKNVGDQAFRFCSLLTSVNISEGMTSIGESAFSGCVSLMNMRIPDSVTSIGSYAFKNCSSLACVTIGNSVKIIGNHAFYGCSSLTNVTIPDSVTIIDEFAFLDCSSLTNVTIPDSVTSIGQYAFQECSSLASVKIGDGVTSIGHGAFYYCSSLANLTIGNSVASIAWGAFRGCTALKSVTIPDSVTSIGEYAFRECSSLASVTILPKTVSIYDKEYTIPGTATIYGYADSTAAAYAANYSTSFVEIIAHGECGADGDNLIWILTANGELIISGTGDMADYESTDFPWYSYSTSITKVTIENGVTSIGTFAFTFCKNLASVTIGNSVTNIGDYAFSDCGLTIITIPDNVTNIYANAFNGCGNLTSITLGDGITWISEGLFYGCTNLSAVTIGSNVEEIYPTAFSYCKSLNSVNFPASVTKIGSGAFEWCESLATITVDKNNSVYYSEGNCVIEKASKALVLGCANSEIPEDVTRIGDQAFYGCTALESVIIPDSVKNIGITAFSECWNLTSVIIPNSMLIIDYCAFQKCTSLTSVTIFSKNVEIYDSENTFPTSATIYGYAGSTAQAYAEKYGRIFVELDAPIIAYQVTKDEGGEFSLRVISGLNSLNYKNYGFEITVTTKDADGNDVVQTVSATSDKVYSSVYGGTTEYSIKENFGYEYAGLATVTGLAIDSDYTKLEIQTYVVSDGEKLYGNGATLLYEGLTNEDGFPALTVVTE